MRSNSESGAVDLDRKNSMSHIVFGSGIHNCLGAHLARREIKIVVDEWLDRVSPFQIPEDEVPVTYASALSLALIACHWNGESRMPLITLTTRDGESASIEATTGARSWRTFATAANQD